ncbi:hypothetical protein TSAR_007421 [Trichomalopsis sarcophagae]|uniref:Uncharacterized protein n=1 Tax=Trichomalopsis sarcophagae TaxID=543379 RepID=A0A232EDU7_9HYME|nr:hypothetical protein TSAR_007421 [Trichomalopsis sarcophagae]
MHEEIQFLENTSNSQSSEQALDTLLNLVDDPFCEESTLSILVRANEILQSVTPIISEGIDLMSNAYIQILRR